MKKLQAALRDESAKKWKGAKSAYKIGSAFKGCHCCGEYEERVIGGRIKKIYSSGFDVMRSYLPKATGWTYYCLRCSAKDYAAWENAQDIGLEPILGTRSAIVERKKEIKKERDKQMKAAIEAIGITAKSKPPVQGVAEGSKIAKLEELRLKLAELERQIRERAEKK